MQRIVGGCLCGQVRYSAEADPLMTAICHCKNCQKQAGTAFTVVVGLPRSSVSVQGSLKTFEDTGASGQPVHRRFCPNCGSPVISEVDVMPDVTFIKSGTLDDTSWLRPTMEVWCESEQPWVRQGGERQRFPRMPG